MSTSQLTLEQFRSALPDKVKKSVNQELIDQINQVLSHPEEFEHYKDNLISYTSVMKDGKYRIEQYLYAVMYVSHKLRGATNIEAYMKTFPDRYAAHIQNGTSSKDIASYVTAYNKTDLVTKIMAQTMIPVHVLNMEMYQQALNEQMNLGLTAKSEKVRSDALNSVLVQLRPPEIKKVELDIAVKPGNQIDALREAAIALAEEQRKAIAAGAINAEQAAHSGLVLELHTDGTVQ